MEKARIELLLNKEILEEEEKKEIREAADAAGVKYTIRKSCEKCYDSILMKLYEINKSEIVLNISRDGYKLKEATANFRIGDVVYNNATIYGLEVGNLPASVLEAKFIKDVI